MSGEAGGLILIPLGIMAMPYILGGLAVAGAASMTVKAAAAALSYERNNRKRRKQVPYNIHETMNAQTVANIKTSEQMMDELASARESMSRTAQKNDVEAYRDYVNNLQATRAKTMQKISDSQVKFNTAYRKTISQAMSEVSREISGCYESSMKELATLKGDNSRAKEIAESYLNEAKTLLESLMNDYEGKKFSPRQLDALNGQFQQAKKLFDSGRFESAIAASKDLTVSTLEEIFEADALKQEWENYFKLCVVLSEEVKTYLDSNAVITQDAKDYAEKASGLKLEDEIVGIKIADYTDRDSQGRTLFETLSQKSEEIYNIFHPENLAPPAKGRGTATAVEGLDSKEGHSLTTDELKSYAKFLNTELYPKAAACINKAVLNMNNAFSRQNISEELIDFFEEHNFTFSGYAYDEGKHDKALHIGLENETTGEELIITLAPELLADGDIQTHVDLKQTKGDEANEQRKAYYRECVSEVVKGKTPQAKVNIQCNAATRNKLSSDTQTRKMLRK